MRRILIVEDDRDSLGYYRLWMEGNAGSDNEEIEVTACASVNAAKQAVSERESASKDGNGGRRFDLCLLDVQVPGDVSGLDFAIELAGLGVREQNIIIITGGDAPEIGNASYQHISKPVDESKLMGILINNGFGARDNPRTLIV